MDKQLLKRVDNSEKRIVDLYNKVKKLPTGDAIEITAEKIETLVTTNSLKPNALYKITGFNKNMPENSAVYLPVKLYDDGTDSGTTIYVTALDSNTFSPLGFGEFYNPRYGKSIPIDSPDFNHLEASYDNFVNSLDGQIGTYILTTPMVMHDIANDDYYKIIFTSWTNNNGGGGFSYNRQLITPTGDAPIVSFTKSNYGTEKDIISPGVLEITRGNNGPLFNKALENSSNNSTPTGTEWYSNIYIDRYDNTDGTGLYYIWDGDNPTPEQIPTYQVDQVVYWGGYAWKNLSGEVGTKVDTLNLSLEDWEKIPYTNTTYYQKVIDQVKIDWSHKMIVGRKDEENNLEVWSSIYFMTIWGFDYNPISVMCWGNSDAESARLTEVTIANSYAELINFKGTEFYSNDIVDNSVFKNNYLGKRIKISGNSFSHSNFKDNTFIFEAFSGNFFNFNILEKSDFSGNTLRRNSRVVSNTLIKSSLQYNVLEKNSGFENNTLTSFSVISNLLSNDSVINSNVLERGGLSENTLGYTESPMSNPTAYFISNIITDSSISSNTFLQSYFSFNTIKETSSVYNNSVNQSDIRGNTLLQESNITGGIFVSGGGIYYNSLLKSNLYLSASGSLSGKTIQKATAKFVTLDENFSASTNLFLNVEKNLYTRADGTKRLSYFNNSDTLTVSNVDA